MEWFIAISGLAILIFGSWVALWWWRLSRRIAPYKDELEREKARAGQATDDDRVIIIPPMSPRPSIPPGQSRPPSRS